MYESLINFSIRLLSAECLGPTNEGGPTILGVPQSRHTSRRLPSGQSTGASFFSIRSSMFESQCASSLALEEVVLFAALVEDAVDVVDHAEADVVVLVAVVVRLVFLAARRLLTPP